MQWFSIIVIINV